MLSQAALLGIAGSGALVLRAGGVEVILQIHAYLLTMLVYRWLNASESTCIRVFILQFAFDLQVLSTGEIVTEAEDEH